MSNKLRILFMGTPEFAVASLGSLLMNGYNVCGVVTTPDKPAGRGRKLTPSPVKLFSELSSLPLLQPVSLKESSFLAQVKGLAPDLIVVVAFRFIPDELWSIPHLGTFNLHASLLPQYRGAAPINHAIINGETVTGVTTFFIEREIDTGGILFRESTDIYPSDNAGDLHQRLMRIGARLVVKTVEAIDSGTINPRPQEEFIAQGEILKPAPKIFPNDCIIDWESSSLDIHNKIRGLAPSPSASSAFIMGDKVIRFKLHESQAYETTHSLAPGEIVTDGSNHLRIACGGGFLNILSLQLAGRKRVTTEEILRGFDVGGFRAAKRTELQNLS